MPSVTVLADVLLSAPDQIHLPVQGNLRGRVGGGKAVRRLISRQRTAAMTDEGLSVEDGEQGCHHAVEHVRRDDGDGSRDAKRE